jgi:hypothetical protein
MVCWKKHSNLNEGKIMNYLILSSMISVTLMPVNMIFPFSIVILLFYILIDSSVINYFKRKSTYFLLVILVVIQPILIGESTHSILGIGYSFTGFENGISMFFRAAVIIGSITIMNHKTKTNNLQKFLKRIGFVQFEDVLKKAEEVLPQTRITLMKSIETVKQNNSVKKKWHNPAELFARIIVQLLHKPIK